MRPSSWAKRSLNVSHRGQSVSARQLLAVAGGLPLGGLAAWAWAPSKTKGATVSGASSRVRKFRRGPAPEGEDRVRGGLQVADVVGLLSHQAVDLLATDHRGAALDFLDQIGIEQGVDDLGHAFGVVAGQLHHAAAGAHG